MNLLTRPVLLVAVPLFMIFAGSTKAGAAGAFQGNPNVTITAINTSAGIAVSRSSCSVPCFVQVSASAITATGSARPYEDLDYSWDFGDPTGNETFSQPIASNGSFSPADVNANTAQTGPEA